MATDFDASRFGLAVRRELGKAKLNARQEVRAAGEDAVQIAKQRAPRDSGEMAESIRAEHGQDQMGPYSDVTVDPFYATFVEFGTSQMPARPFMRPAVASAIRRLRRSR